MARCQFYNFFFIEIDFFQEFEFQTIRLECLELYHTFTTLLDEHNTDSYLKTYPAAKVFGADAAYDGSFEQYGGELVDTNDEDGQDLQDADDEAGEEEDAGDDDDDDDDHADDDDAEALMEIHYTGSKGQEPFAEDGFQTY